MFVGLMLVPARRVHGGNAEEETTQTTHSYYGSRTNVENPDSYRTGQSYDHLYGYARSSSGDRHQNQNQPLDPGSRRITTGSEYSVPRTGARDYSSLYQDYGWQTTNRPRRTTQHTATFSGYTGYDDDSSGYARSQSGSRNDNTYGTPYRRTIYDDSYGSVPTTTPAGRLKGVINSIKNALGASSDKDPSRHSATGSHTSDQATDPSSSFSKYSKYLMPALTFGGKQLAKLISKKFASNKEVTSTAMPAVARMSGYSQILNTQSSMSYGNTVLEPFIEVPVHPKRQVFTDLPTRPPFMRRTYVWTRLPVVLTTTSSEAGTVDPCWFIEWDRELPFTSLPTMALAFLANHSISGHTTELKLEFFFEFLRIAEESYNDTLSVADGGTIPVRCRNKIQAAAPPNQVPVDSTRCRIAKRMRIELPECHAGAANPEPVSSAHLNLLLAAVEQLRHSYLNSSTSGYFEDLIEAATTCLNAASDSTLPRGCLDYSLTRNQLLTIKQPTSVFASEEICSRFVDLDLASCAINGPESASCSMDHLHTIKSFARKFYLCT